MYKRRKYTVLISLVIVTASVFCAVMLKSGKAKTLTVTDADGVTYIAILDQNREVYAGFTDADRNLYAARIDDGGHVVLDDSCYMVQKDYTGEFPYNNTTNQYGVVIDQKQDETFDYAGAEVSEITTATPTQSDTGDTTASGGNTVESTGTNTNTPHLADDFIKLFNSENFVMSFSTDDPDLPDTITMAVKGKSIYMDTSIEGMACKVLIDGDKNKGYIIIPSIRIYCELPPDMSEGLNTDDFAMESTDNCENIQESTVSLSGRECKCERYIFPDGRERAFYFYNGNLVRMDMTLGSETSIYNINSISSQIDNSWFETPRGYIKVNLSWLESQGFEG